MVTGAGPQAKVMIPPWATASTTARDVQPAGVPSPTTTSGWVVSTGWASAGNGPPPGLPGAAVTRRATAVAVTGPSMRGATSWGMAAEEEAPAGATTAGSTSGVA